MGRSGLLKFYEINPAYIDFLSVFAPHLFKNKKASQVNERKYIGIVLSADSMDYFVPLSSFKEKHKKMHETVDFIKIKDYAVLNINNMFPAPSKDRRYVDINSIKNANYRNLLRNEYRIIKLIEAKILRNAKAVYTHKILNGTKTGLAKRCNDFKLLEEKCAEWEKLVKSRFLYN